MSDARKRAEEALAAYDACKGYEYDIYAVECVTALRALLAERDALKAENARLRYVVKFIAELPDGDCEVTDDILRSARKALRDEK